MNLRECQNGTKGKCVCIYGNFIKDENGKNVFESCNIKEEDHYNIFPEHDGNFDYVFHEDNVSSAKILRTESLTDHQSGNEVEPLRKEKPKSWEYDHPTVMFVNETYPVTNKSKGLDQLEVGELFGTPNNLTLVTKSWKPGTSFNIDVNEKCNNHIWAQPDKTGTVTPKMLKDYSNKINNWINYSSIVKLRPPENTLFIHDISDFHEIYHWVDKNIPSDMKANILEFLAYAKEHKVWMNWWDILKGNGATGPQLSRLYRAVSFNSKTSLYKNFNLKNCIDLYSRLHLVDLSNNMLIKKTNLVNYILNYPRLKEFVEKESFIANRNERRENVIHRNLNISMVLTFLKKAIRDNVLGDISNNSDMSWLKILIKKAKIREPERASVDEIADVVRLRKFDKNVIYPAMVRVKDIINYKENDKKSFLVFSYFIEGTNWCQHDLKIFWKVVQGAVKKDFAPILWRFVEKVINGNSNLNEEPFRFIESRKIENHSFELKPFVTDFIEIKKYKNLDEEEFYLRLYEDNIHFNEYEDKT